jgi:hypothetical protein
MRAASGWSGANFPLAQVGVPYWVRLASGSSYSNLHLNREQGGEDKATKTAHIVRLGAEDEANTVIVSNADRN